jgi:hypothetical protein
VMSSVSPRQQNRFLPLPSQGHRSRSPSPPQRQTPAPPTPVAPLSPSSPRQLLSNNPRLHWEQNHRKKIQEIRQKNFIQQKESQEKEALAKQERQSQCQLSKDEKEQIKMKTKEYKEKRSSSAHCRHTQQLENAQIQRKINQEKDFQKKLNQKLSIDKEKKLNRISANKVKEIHETHAVLFAMNRHGFNDLLRGKEKRTLEEKQEKVREQRHCRNNRPEGIQQRPQSAGSRCMRVEERERGGGTPAVTTATAVQYNRMISQFEGRIQHQKENETKYRRGHLKDEEESVGMQNRPFFSEMDDEDMDNSEVVDIRDSELKQNRMKISVGAISIDENTENTSVINLDSPRDIATKLRQEIFSKKSPSFR